ncbi:MAG: hypothetical protein ACRCTG_04985 [Aestuariivirga sp.]
MLALAIAVAMVAGGTAIDMARLMATQAALSAAVDAAVLQAVTSGLSSTSELEDLALSALELNYNNLRYGELLETELDVSGNNYTFSAVARLDTSFMRLAGINSVRVPVSAQALKQAKNLEVALVLDVTSSMSETEMDTLQQAATDLVATVMQGAGEGVTTRFAIVPYADAVNLGDYAELARGPISSGTCTTPGCEKYTFLTDSRSYKTYSSTSCVTERIGDDAYTDDSVESAPVGYFYDFRSVCTGNEILPLTDDTEAIEEAIETLKTGRYTAGHIGIGWGWYTLSPNIGLWSGNSVPGAYDDSLTSKVVVVMTDGQFNTAYCNGVYSSDESNETAQNRISCNAQNGSSRSQALSLCTAMKANGITIYTVGFDIASYASATSLLSSCSSGSDYSYLAESTDDLLASFSDIAARLGDIRLSR